MTQLHVNPSPPGVPGAVLADSQILGEDITFPGAGGEDVNAYLALPAGASEPRPAMIVIHEAGGLGEHIRDVVNRFANLGYVALGVDLYTREGGPPPMDDMRAMMGRLFSIPDKRVIGDLGRRRRAALARGRRRARRMHRLLHGRALHPPVRYRQRPAGRRRRLLGWLHRPIDARAADHPGAPGSPTGARAPALLPAARGGGRRRSKPLPRRRRAAQGRRRTERQPVQVDVYAGAGHAFFADYRPSYSAAAGRPAVGADQCRSWPGISAARPERPRAGTRSVSIVQEQPARQDDPRGGSLGAQVVDVDRGFGRHLHAPARHHGRQRRPARHPALADSSFSDLQWVVNAYSLTLAAFLLTAGSLADLLGRRRVFVSGLILFTISSAACGLAGSPLELDLFRAVQGAGGAMMFATSLALIASAFHGRERGTAFGIYGGVIGAAVAVGPVIGGVITSGIGWEWIFFVNVPIGIGAVA